MITHDFGDTPPEKDALFFGRHYENDSYNSIKPNGEFQATLILEGKGSFFVLDKVIPYNKGNLFFFGSKLSTPLKSLKIDKRNKSSAPLRTVSLFFDQKQVEAALKNLPETYRINKIIEYSEFGIKIPKTNLKFLAKQIVKINLATGLKKFLLFLKFIDDASKNENISVLSTKADLSDLRDKNKPKLRNIYDFIKRNHKETITLEQIAEIAHMSPTGFCKFFKTMTQKTFLQYLTEVRIENACALLHNTDNTIGDCCFSSGYNNISNFQRHFKKTTGMSPSQYRTNIKHRPKNNIEHDTKKKQKHT